MRVKSKVPNVRGGFRISQMPSRLTPKMARPKSIRDCQAELTLALEWLKDIEVTETSSRPYHAATAALRRVRYFLNDMEKEST